MRTARLVLTAALLAAALPAAAVDFDAAIDAAAVLSEAEAAAVSAAPVAAATVRAASFRRYERDCASFRFGPNDGLASDAVWLRSTEWVEECYQTGDPRHGGGRQCHERPGRTYRERVQVTLTERKPLAPWESDSFQVCLEGPWVDVRQGESAYEYRRASGTGQEASIVATPVKKTPMRPDPTGVTAVLAADLTATFTDKWASYYQGEKVVLKFTLKKHLPNWFDPVILEKETELDVASSYAVDMAAELVAAASKPEAGKTYYIEYQVKRVGAVSKPVFTKALESNKAAYVPSAAVAAN